MKTEMAVFKARMISSKPAGTGAAIQPSECYCTHIPFKYWISSDLGPGDATVTKN